MKSRFFSLISSVIIASLLCLAAVPAYPEIDLKGFVDSYHAARIKSPNDFLSSRNRLRLEMTYEKGKALVFASVNILKHHTLSDQTGLSLREAYMEYAADTWDVRVGRQLIIWGKADGVQITDIISPMDYTEFLARDYDDIRMPVDAVRFRLLRETFNFELIWVPIFQSAVLPGPGNPWAISQDFPGDVDVVMEDAIAPKITLGNSEFGGKLSFYLEGVDFAISAVHTWDKFPALHRESLTDNRLLVRSEHHRLTFFGLEISLPLSAFVLRSESALLAGKRFMTDEEGLLKKKSLKWLVGLDWYPGDSWNISMQLTGTKIFDHEEVLTDESHTIFSTISCSKKLMRETLTLSTFAYIGLNNGDVFNRFSIDYALTDELRLSWGADFFFGSTGQFGQFRDNNQVWIKARFSF